MLKHTSYAGVADIRAGGTRFRAKGDMQVRTLVVGLGAGAILGLTGEGFALMFC